MVMKMEKRGLKIWGEIGLVHIEEITRVGTSVGEVINDEEWGKARGRSAELFDSRQKFRNTESA
jgi:hypothetical protein